MTEIEIAAMQREVMVLRAQLAEATEEREELRAAVRSAAIASAEAEKERCARIADKIAASLMFPSTGNAIAIQIANQIRRS